jgi:pimeloyl-ACP methyl ester carboxylesterase
MKMRQTTDMIDLRHDEVPVGDAIIHMVTVGAAEAPGLVLLHGWPESWVTWCELIPFAARDHRVVAIDLPGIGGSSRGTLPGSKIAIAHTVHSLIGTLGLTDVTLVTYRAWR